MAGKRLQVRGARRALSSLIAAHLVAAMALAPASFAATPSSGTLSSAAPSVTWSGGPYTAVTADPSLCTSATCDTFALTVNVSATYYSSNPGASVRVGLTWGSSTDDFDLYVYDSAGNLVGSSAQGGTTSELADLGQPASGTYTVQVVAFATANTIYSGSAVLGPAPTLTTRTGRYKTGKFTFSTPQPLPGPADLLFNVQGVEPRVAHDGAGNIYVAAIQGVPAGTDIWKSTDGGRSFAYLGQPDGAQAASILARGGGVGGGDEDLAIGASGNVYVNSLWLGSSTQCSSFDGGATWIVNPFSTDAPLVDRQWIAASGSSEVYLTYKQLGLLLSGTQNLFVAKSFDGGVTFSQVMPLTTPLGVQPGLQGNIAVDRLTGSVYNVFTSAQGNELYLARSTDGGLTWALTRVAQAPEGTSLGNVFPSLAVDSASGLHVVFSDGRSIYLIGSADRGATWTLPVRVSNGADTKTALAPWVVAGAAGKLDIVWWGTGASSNLDTAADWKVFMAQTVNPFDRTPTFTQRAATGIMHTGAICVEGTACPDGTRSLAEYFAHDVSPDGNALIAYPDDKNGGTGSAVTFFVRQTGGPTVN
jgi:hypothetical protein